MLPTGSLPAQVAANVTIHADAPLATVPPLACGVNTAVWDGHLLDASVPPLLEQAGVTVLRFPGGSTTDIYHWQSNTASQGGYVNPRNTFDAFMGLVSRLHAQALLCVNYGTDLAGKTGGDPDEAAGWVDYANHVKGYGVKYWEIGNEIYGNGEYGASFETDLHADHTPVAYGRAVASYARAMKAKDATIKVGVVLAAPAHFPDGKPPDWNTGVLAQCGGVIDFVIVHWYPQEPGRENDRFLLGAPGQIGGMMTRLHELIARFCGPDAARVQIFVTETNSVTHDPGKQTIDVVNGLFVADDYATWLEQGVANVDVWALHNGLSHGIAGGSLHSRATFGDYGILSNGGSPEPATDTPFPAYYGLRMFTYLAKPGDRFVSVSSSQPLLGVHAVRQLGGSLALQLINKDPANACAVGVVVNGFAPASTATDHSYGGVGSSEGISSATTKAGPTFTRLVPPYSMTTVVLPPVVSPTPGTAATAAP